MENRPATILVIEDHQANRDLIVYLLNAFGYQVLNASNGQDGVEITRMELPDLIICDIQLPKLDGYGVAKYLKTDTNLRSIPLIAITAMAMVGDREKILSAGFDGYIAKPIVPEMFIGQVETFLHSDQQSSRQSVKIWETPVEPTTTSATVMIGTILIVDNSHINHILLQEILRPAGYNLINASSAKEGLELAQRFSPDLIISDFYMPNQNGVEFAKAVRADKNLTSIPFFLISASGEIEFQRNNLSNTGITKMISQPIEPHVLLKDIAACLTRDKKGSIE